jgi:hypothetical protein
VKGLFSLACRRRCCWWTVLLLAVGGCGPRERTDDGAPSPKPEPKPTRSAPSTAPRFDSSSGEPVLLRYKFKPGEKLEMAAELDLTIDIATGAQNVSMMTAAALGFECGVAEVDSRGDAAAELVFQHLRMQTVGGPGKIDFNSRRDADSNDPNHRGLAAVIGTPIPIRVSARGRLLSQDTTAVSEAMSRAGAPTMARLLDRLIRQIVHGTFVQLPEEPVRKGDTFEAGELALGMSGIGNLATHARYEVLDVSGEQDQALLKPLVEISMEPTTGGGMRTELESAEVTGWVHFGVREGMVRRSRAKARLTIKGSDARQTSRITTTMELQFRLREPS